MNSIVPAQYGIKEAGRLVVLINKSSLRSYEFIQPDSPVEFEISDISQHVKSMQLRFEVLQMGEWTRSGPEIAVPLNEFELTKTPVASPAQFLISSTPIDTEFLRPILQTCDSDKKSQKKVRQMVTKAVWTAYSDVSPQRTNIDVFLTLANEVLAEQKSQGGYLANCSFYLETFLGLADALGALQLRPLDFFDIESKLRSQENAIPESILSVRQKCLENAHLAAAQTLLGMMASVLETREIAADHFAKAVQLDAQFVRRFGMDQGVFTYAKHVPKNASSSPLDYYRGVRPPVGLEHPVVLISVDENFLRRYGSYLFYIHHILQQPHFHFHLVAPKRQQRRIIKQALKLFHLQADFFGGKKVRPPTFSMEEIPPQIQEQKTYYACSRFLVAANLMRDIDNHLYIMDADLYFEGPITEFLNAISEFELALPIARGTRAFCPWKRFQAGNVFVAKGPKGIGFLENVESYIRDQMDGKNTWMLDQNALDYAVGMSRGSLNIGTYADKRVKRPLFQLPLTSTIESRE